MGLFQTPTPRPNDSVGSYNRRLAPWMFVTSIIITVLVVLSAEKDTFTWILVGVSWVASLVSASVADWSDLTER